MWGILLATEDAALALALALALAGSILTAKLVKLQAEYLGTRKTKMTLHGVPLYISDNYLGFFFAKFGEVSSVSSIKSKAGNRHV